MTEDEWAVYTDNLLEKGLIHPGAAKYMRLQAEMYKNRMFWGKSTSILMKSIKAARDGQRVAIICPSWRQVQAMQSMLLNLVNYDPDVINEIHFFTEETTTAGLHYDVTFRD